MMAVIAYTLVSFLSGSLPFSVWIGRLLLHTNIRLYGDGNPGAANVARAGGLRVGLVAVLFDYLKAFVPVFLAVHVIGFTGWERVPIALAPVLGHAFSPFLAFRGGKAITATFGIWSGITLWEVPIVLGAVLGIGYFSQDNDARSVLAGMAAALVYLIMRGYGAAELAVWLGNVIIVGAKHGRQVLSSSHLRLPWLRRGQTKDA